MSFWMLYCIFEYSCIKDIQLELLIFQFDKIFNQLG